MQDSNEEESRNRQYLLNQDYLSSISYRIKKEIAKYTSKQEPTVIRDFGEEVIRLFNSIEAQRKEQVVLKDMLKIEEAIEQQVPQSFKMQLSSLKNKFKRNNKKKYHSKLQDDYLEIYRCFNTFIYDYDSKRYQMLNKDLFMELKKFWSVHEAVKQEEWGEYSDRSHQDYREFLVFALKFEEQLVRAMNILALHYSREQISRIIGEDNLKFVEDLLRKFITDEKSSLLKKICARKYFYNIKHDKQNYLILKDAILPISEDQTIDNFDVDIIFIPGQSSHPLRSWRLHEKPGNILADRFQYKTWIDEFLIPDIKELFPNLKTRVSCIGYDSETNQAMLNFLNVEDREVPDLADMIDDHMKAANVGDKPVIIIAFSLGGLITKLILQKDQKLNKKVNSIMFIGTPHLGSDFIIDSKEMLGRIIPGIHYFQDLSTLAIPLSEYTDFIFNNVLLSKTTYYLCREDRQMFYNMHQDFLNLGIPFDCIGEGIKVIIPGAGLSYMIVKPESSLAMGARTARIIQDKNHYQLQKVANSRDDTTYQYVKDFVFQGLNDILSKKDIK